MPSADASAASYTLRVNGSVVTSSSSGTGYAWDESSNTLTLNSYSGTGIEYVNLDNTTTLPTFSVVFNGNNTLADSGNDHGSITTSNANMKLSGTGSLTLTSSSACITAAGSGSSSLAVESGAYNLTCKLMALSANNDVTIADGVTIVNQSSNSGISARGNVTINGGTLGFQGGNDTNFGIVANKTLTINGGQIGLNGYSIGMSGDSAVVINNGTIVDNAHNQGIDSHGDITFNGGTTKITATGANRIGNFTAINAFGSNIVLGDGMGIDGGYITTVGDNSHHVWNCSGGEATDVTIAPGISSTVCNNDGATLAAANLGTTIDNPQTADTDWIYGLIAAVLTGTFFLGRRFYLKH